MNNSLLIDMIYDQISTDNQFNITESDKFNIVLTSNNILPNIYDNTALSLFLSEFIYQEKAQFEKSKIIANKALTIISDCNKTNNIMKILLNHSLYTLSHSIEVLLISILIGMEYISNEDYLMELGIAAVLHDIGKIYIPAKVLNKPSKLSNNEWHLMKKHPGLGYQLVKNINSFSEKILEGILLHHENVCGTGYPYGLKEKEISDYAHIIHIADVYTSLSTKRPYHKKVWNKDEIKDYILNNSGILFSSKYTNSIKRNK